MAASISQLGGRGHDQLLAGRPPRASRKRGRDATAPAHAAAGRASPRSTSRRRCGRGRPAGTSGRSRSRRCRAAARPACRRRFPRTLRRGRPARRRTAPRRTAPCAAPGRSAPCSLSLASTVAMACAKSLAGPAQRAEWMPGAPPSASTARPESSAKAGRPAALAAASALMRALSRKLRAGFLGLGQAKLRLPIRPRYRRAPATRASRAACRDCGWR